MFEAAMNKLGWITRVINMSSGEETGRVEFVQNLSPSTTLAGTLISGTAGAGTALEIPDGNSYVVGPSAIKLAAGYVAIQQP